MTWILPLLLAAAGCPTYSEESRTAESEEPPAEEAESAKAAEAAEAATADEPVLDMKEDEGEAEEEPEPAGEAADGTVKHREEAGEPDESGWYAATSTNGGFSIELPGPFDDYQVSPQEGQTMHIVQSEKDSVRYLVQCSVGGKPPEEKLAAIEAQLPQLGDVEAQRRVEQAGGEGVEFRMKSGGTTIGIRSLALGDRLCQMIVEARDTPYPERAAARFVESFSRADEG